MTQNWTALLRHGAATLERNGVSEPMRDARAIAAFALGISPGRVTLALHDPVDLTAKQRFIEGIEQRALRVPLSHIRRSREFYGRSFAVTRDVLDPRPETETLVAAALEQRFSTVLDLGTGSGAILLSLLAERPAATGVGSDLSSAALEIAQENAASLGVSDRTRWVQSDWFSALSGRFDLIVSNPPYIALAEMDDLQPEVREHEPRMALTDEGDGLTAYQAIVAGVRDHLLPSGQLMVEIGPTQATPVMALMKDAGLQDISCLCDLDGRDRLIAARNPT